MDERKIELARSLFESKHLLRPGSEVESLSWDKNGLIVVVGKEASTLGLPKFINVEGTEVPVIYTVSRTLLTAVKAA